MYRSILHNVFREKERIGRLAQIRELVFGAQDGLLGTLGFVSSVSGAFNNAHIVVLAGIAGNVAGAFSICTGSYLASKSERDLYDSEISKALYRLKKYPTEQKDELVAILESEGNTHEAAMTIAEKMAHSHQSFFNTMVQKELGIEPHSEENPLRDAVYAGISFILFSFIPIFPYFFFPIQTAIPISIGTTLVALFIVGAVKGKIVSLHYIRSGFEVLLIGGTAGIGGYILGILLPKLIGS